MKLKIVSEANEAKGSMELPPQFSEELRDDIIKRAILSIHAATRQPYGASPEAGKRAVAKLSRRRRDYKTSYGHGISRVPRKILSRRGTMMNWKGAFAPGTVGGRRSHPPKAEKNWELGINRKERRKAIRSAIAATVQRNLVVARGHKVPEAYPFIIDDSFEALSHTKDVVAALMKLGFENELARCEERSIRAGRGKIRGRRYKSAVGPLLVVSKKCPLMDSAANIPGVNIVSVESLNALVLAPGVSVGRASMFTKAAVERLSKEKLFM